MRSLIKKMGIKLGVLVALGVMLVTTSGASALSSSDGRTALIPVGAGSVSVAYINMYETVATGGIYEGRLVARAVQRDRYAFPVFSIAPGRLVHFVAFETSEKAQAATRWSFTYPPYTNRVDQDGIPGRICTTGSDYQNCTTSLSLRLQDQFLGLAVNGNATNRAVVEILLQRTNATSTLVSNATVNLYDEGTNQRVATVWTGSRGVATFAIERGRRYYFEGIDSTGAVYGGRMKTYYPSETASFYINDNNQLVDAHDGSSTHVLRLIGYPTTSQNSYPYPVVTPAPVTVYPYPVDPQPYDYRVTAAPIITSPVSNQILTTYPRTMYVSWTRVANAVRYEVTVECDVCSTNPNWSSRKTYSTTATNLWTSSLAGDNQFRIRVRGIGRDGNAGPLSNYVYVSFQTASYSYPTNTTSYCNQYPYNCYNYAPTSSTSSYYYGSTYYPAYPSYYPANYYAGYPYYYGAGSSSSVNNSYNTTNNTTYNTTNNSYNNNSGSQVALRTLPLTFKPIQFNKPLPTIVKPVGIPAQIGVAPIQPVLRPARPVSVPTINFQPVKLQTQQAQPRQSVVSLINAPLPVLPKR